MKIRRKFTLSEDTTTIVDTKGIKLIPQNLRVEEIDINLFDNNNLEASYKIRKNFSFTQVENSKDTYEINAILEEKYYVFKLTIQFVAPNKFIFINNSDAHERYVQAVIREYYNEKAPIEYEDEEEDTSSE